MKNGQGKEKGEEKRERCAKDFPVAVTNYLKLRGLKQHKFIILQFWTSEVQEESCWDKERWRQSWLLLKAVEEN